MSKLDCGTYDTIVGNKSILIWLKSSSFGQSGLGNIMNNGKLTVRVNTTNAVFQVSSDGTTFVSSANNAVVLGLYTFIAITRKSDGKVSFYIGNTSTAPALSSTADQASGTPVAGTTNIILGNNTAGTATFDGRIASFKIYDGILSTDELTQEWSSTRRFIS